MSAPTLRKIQRLDIVPAIPQRLRIAEKRLHIPFVQRPACHPSRDFRHSCQPNAAQYLSPRSLRDDMLRRLREDLHVKLTGTGFARELLEVAAHTSQSYRIQARTPTFGEATVAENEAVRALYKPGMSQQPDAAESSTGRLAQRPGRLPPLDPAGQRSRGVSHAFRFLL